MHNLLLVYSVNLYMFWAYLSPSSGDTTVCIQQLVLSILFRWLSVVLVGLELCSNPTRTTDTHLKRIVSTKFCIHRLYLLMMGLDMPKICRGWRNILRISCASSCLYLHYYSEMHSQQTIKCSGPTACWVRMFINKPRRPAQLHPPLVSLPFVYYLYVSICMKEVYWIINVSPLGLHGPEGV